MSERWQISNQKLARETFLNKSLGCLGFCEDFDHNRGNIKVWKQCQNSHLQRLLKIGLKDWFALYDLVEIMLSHQR